MKVEQILVNSKKESESIQIYKSPAPLYDVKISGINHNCKNRFRAQNYQTGKNGPQQGAVFNESLFNLSVEMSSEGTPKEEDLYTNPKPSVLIAIRSLVLRADLEE